jgi:hypothetical protein
MRENSKANPGIKPYRENKEGRQPSVFRLQKDNPIERIRKGDNPRFSSNPRFSGDPRFLGYKEKTLRKKRRHGGSDLTLRFVGFRFSKTTKVSHISERYSQQNLLRSITLGI